MICNAESSSSNRPAISSGDSHALVIELVKGKRRREALLNHKNINPNIQNNQGQTPLHLTWDRSVIQLLLQAGADASIKDNEGRTPWDVHAQNDPILIMSRRIYGW